MVTVPSASDLAHDCPGWGSWSDAPILFLRRRPLTTLGRPTPTAIADSQWCEPRLDAFSTDARVAGSSVTVAGPAALGQLLVLAVSGGQSRLVMSGMRNAGQDGSGKPVLRRVLAVGAIFTTSRCRGEYCHRPSMCP